MGLSIILEFYLSWVYVLPLWIINIPITFIEASVWVFMTHYVIGYDPNVGRYMLNYNETGFELKLLL